MALWTVSFLKLWKRKSAILAHDWSCIDDTEIETPRPEFIAKAPYREKNRITGKEEPSFPRILRIQRMIIGSGVTMTMAIVIIIILIYLLKKHW